MTKTHKTRVGRFGVPGDCEPVRIEHDGSWGMLNEDLERLELAIKVFSQADLINGEDLRCETALRPRSRRGTTQQLSVGSTPLDDLSGPRPLSQR